METNTGTMWNTSQCGCIRSTLFHVMVGVAVSLRQAEWQGGRGQPCLFVISTGRQMVGWKVAVAEESTVGPKSHLNEI